MRSRCPSTRSRKRLPQTSSGSTSGTTPFFAVPHFDGYAAVLVQQSRLGELSYDELAEVITDAWRSRAPARLRRQLEE